MGHRSYIEHPADVVMEKASLDHKQTVCRGLCRSVREVSFDSLRVIAEEHGFRVQQAWRASSGEGFKCVAARLIVEGENILAVAFRSTFGNDEWGEYTQKYFKRRFLPHDGEEPGSKLKVFTIWSETLDEVWRSPGEEMDGSRDTLRAMIWRQLNSCSRVWLTGHSKGGAVASTAAARLLLGDSTRDADLIEPAIRRPEGDMVADAGGPLSRLSVFTFNAPMAFTAPLAELYDARLAEVRGEHVRLEHKADQIRKLPPDAGMVHVGRKQLEGKGLAQDPGVIIGSAVSIGGFVAAAVAAAVKIAKSH